MKLIKFRVVIRFAYSLLITLSVGGAGWWWWSSRRGRGQKLALLLHI